MCSLYIIIESCSKIKNITELLGDGSSNNFLIKTSNIEGQ